MKRIAIIAAVLTVTAVAAIAWQIHACYEETRRAIETEHLNQRLATLEYRLSRLNHHQPPPHDPGHPNLQTLKKS